MTVTFDADIRDRLGTLLERFERLAQPGPFNYKWCHHADGGVHQEHIVFGCMVHGNEFGSLPAAVQLIESLRSGELQYGGKVTVFIGNPEAARQNRRYLEADLNRVFLDTGLSRHEDVRAQAIMPILDAANVLVDFHQTILDTEHPFYIFPWHRTGWHWARAIRSTDVWVTRNPKQTFSKGSMCSDEYVSGKTGAGITVELSKKGFHPDAEKLCWRTMLETLRVADQLHSGASIVKQAEQNHELIMLETTFSEPFDDPAKSLRPGLTNFKQLQAGTQIHAEGTPPLIVPIDGAILFPKYPERRDTRAIAPWPKELYRLVTPLTVHPKDCWDEPTES